MFYLLKFHSVWNFLSQAKDDIARTSLNRFVTYGFFSHFATRNYIRVHAEAGVDALAENVPHRMQQSSRQTGSDRAAWKCDPSIRVSCQILLIAPGFKGIILPGLSH